MPISAASVGIGRFARHVLAGVDHHFPEAVCIP